jgi:hypothetical protein
MRLSIRIDDPGYDRDARAAKIFLNGATLDRVITADEEAGTILRYAQGPGGRNIVEGAKFKEETLGGCVKITFEKGVAVAERAAEHERMPWDERREILERKLKPAEAAYVDQTALSRHDFSIDAVTHYADWLGLFEPKVAIEFLHALAGVHDVRDAAKYRAAVLRLETAKAAMHAAMASVGERADRKPGVRVG